MFARKKKGKVFVGLSGGVDSSVVAALLKKKGYEVVGVYIRTWQPDWLPECSYLDDRRSAMRVAATLEIPFLECDLRDAYKKKVADYLISMYKEGKTPNPDVMCNREVKFGEFFRFAKERGADYVATGHYVVNKGLCLYRGRDKKKDQSYFLWKLTTEDLNSILFPLGNMKKEKVRRLAKKFGLPTASRPDSQGICMLGEVDIKEFVSHYVDVEKGEVRDLDEKVIGWHGGAILYTLGERRGFYVDNVEDVSKPYYVVGKDVESNILYVSHEYEGDKRVAKTSYELGEVNNICGELLEGGKYKAQIRHQGKEYFVEVVSYEEDSALVEFSEPILVASGQSVVFYSGRKCVGGGVVL